MVVLVAVTFVGTGCREDVSPENAVCATPDEGDLLKVATCYFHADKDWTTTGAKRWPFLSTQSKAQITEIEYNKMFTEPPKCVTSSVAVLNPELSKTTTKGIVVPVSVAKRCAKCSEVETDSWIREESGWRRLWLPNNQELIDQKISMGDYAAAKKLAEEWLAIDPYSITAHNQFVFATGRGARSSSTKRTKDEMIRSMSAINPKDSTVLFRAVTDARNVDVAQTFLDEMAMDDCARDSAIANVANKFSEGKKGLEMRLDFLDRHESTEPRIVMTRAVTLGQLNRFSELKTLMSEHEAAIAKMLAESDPTYSVRWACNLAAVLSNAKDYDAAHRWVTLGLKQDPTDRDLTRLLKYIKTESAKSGRSGNK